MPIPSLAQELLRSQGVRYQVKGRVWLGENKFGQLEPLLTFNRVGGELLIDPEIGRAEAHGTLRIDVQNLRARDPRLDGPIRRQLLQAAAYPYATLKIYDVEGIGGQKVGIGKFGLGRLQAELHLLAARHWIDTPVRIHRFSQNAYGVEPTAPLTIYLDQLGLGSSLATFNRAVPNEYPAELRAIFRLEVSR